LESDLAWAPTHTLTNPFTEVVDHSAATSILAAGCETVHFGQPRRHVELRRCWKTTRSRLAAKSSMEPMSEQWPNPSPLRRPERRNVRTSDKGRYEPWIFRVLGVACVLVPIVLGIDSLVRPQDFDLGGMLMTLAIAAGGVALIVWSFRR